MKQDIIIILLIFFVLIIVFGLLIGGKTNVIESFSPDLSSGSDVQSGASQLYNWGLPNKKYDVPKEEYKCPNHNKHDTKTKCDICSKAPNINNYEIIFDNKSSPMPIDYREVCKKCDITINNDIDKYVLKASIPPSPKLDDYVTKNMIPADRNLNDYILKSEIKPCPRIDMNEYIKKSEITPCIPPPKCPDCPTCPSCPECPICPKCPPKQECTTKVFNYKISEHPDYEKYTPIEKVEQCQNKNK